MLANKRGTTKQKPMKLLRERRACRKVIGENEARNHNHDDDDTSSDPRLGE